MKDQLYKVIEGSAHPLPSGPLTDPTFFDWLKKRATRLMKSDEGCAALDKGIVPVLQCLNRDENLATVFSCTGHPERGEKDSLHDNFYIMSAILANEGFERLYRLRDEVNAFQESTIASDLLSPEQVMKCRVKLRLSLTNQHAPNAASATWYPAWILSGHIPSPSKGAVLYRDELFAHLGRLDVQS